MALYVNHSSGVPQGSLVTLTLISLLIIFTKASRSWGSSMQVHIGWETLQSHSIGKGSPKQLHAFIWILNLMNTRKCETSGTWKEGCIIVLLLCHITHHSALSPAPHREAATPLGCFVEPKKFNSLDLLLVLCKLRDRLPSSNISFCSLAYLSSITKGDVYKLL